MLKMELPGRRKEGTLQRRFADVVKEDMEILGVAEERAKVRVRRRQLKLQLIKAVPKRERRRTT